MDRDKRVRAGEMPSRVFAGAVSGFIAGFLVSALIKKAEYGKDLYFWDGVGAAAILLGLFAALLFDMFSKPGGKDD